MVTEVNGQDVAVAPPVTVAAEPVAVIRCWWCDEPVGATPDGTVIICVNPKCEAYRKGGIDWDTEPLCEQRTYGGYGRNAASPPEYCEARPIPGTSHCAGHTEDEWYDEPFDDDGPVFLVEGHEHNDY